MESGVKDMDNIDTSTTMCDVSSRQGGAAAPCIGSLKHQSTASDWVRRAQGQVETPVKSSLERLDNDLVSCQDSANKKRNKYIR